MKKYIPYIVLLVCLIFVILLATKILFFRIDLTQEKRFTISKNSKELLQSLSEPASINIYLGEADANIAKLKSAVNDMLDEFSVYSSKPLTYKYINPSKAENDAERNKNYDKLEDKGMSPITISLRDAQGKISQQIIFPWAEVMMKDDTLPVCIMQPTGMKTGEESVNAAIEELEYNFIDAIRILEKKSVEKIAFLEGHNELSEIEIYFAEDALSRYYEIDRGVLGNDAGILKNYKAIVIAKPTEPFSESDKFIIDQYIMDGGKVFWLLDVIKISQEELSKQGISPVVEVDLNLNDMFFRYGVRVEPSVVQDMQCIQTPVNVAMSGEPAKFESVPWPYSPLLMTNPNHPTTKNLMAVKADYPSFLSQVSQENGIQMDVLLTTSSASHIDAAPTNIDIKTMIRNKPEEYFTAQYVPVAVSMEGEFESAFAHRLVPQNLENLMPRKDRSAKNKMIVVADGDIIRNELDRSQKGTIGVVPLGLDRLTGQNYGNNNFIINALQYLTEDTSWIELRNRALQLRLLNKHEITAQRVFWQIINIVCPLLILTIFGLIYSMIRKYRVK
ncbi:MAG: gliding motility-associated ABC transporter substrate-binding protein GldG [Prevotellaceae bacterium]|nr:gliding motility-associated ABC transporter substrate-binding protein GldG [Prevotellaceae bacterium]